MGGKAIQQRAAHCPNPSSFVRAIGNGFLKGVIGNDVHAFEQRLFLYTLDTLRGLNLRRLRNLRTNALDTPRRCTLRLTHVSLLPLNSQGRMKTPLVLNLGNNLSWQAGCTSGFPFQMSHMKQLSHFYTFSLKRRRPIG